MFTWSRGTQTVSLGLDPVFTYIYPAGEHTFSFSPGAVQSPHQLGEGFSRQWHLLDILLNDFQECWADDVTKCVPDLQTRRICTAPRQNAQLRAGWGPHSEHTVVDSLSTAAREQALQITCETRARKARLLLRYS